MKNTTGFYKAMAAARGYGQTSSSIACEAAIEARPITSAVLWDLCQQTQRKRLISLAQKQAAASLGEIDVKALNRSFPLDALPRPIREMTRTIGDYYGTPYAAIAAIGIKSSAAKSSADFAMMLLLVCPRFVSRLENRACSLTVSPLCGQIQIEDK